MRLHLALKVSSLDLRDDRFRKLKANLEKKHIEYNWKETFHIPLCELGDMGRGTFMGYFNALKEIVTLHPGFKLKLYGLWGHPYQGQADMLWIGVQSSREFRSLQDDVVYGLNLEKEAGVRPHIPLVILDRALDVTNLIAPFKRFDFGNTVVDQIIFVERLSGSIPTRVIGTVALNPDENYLTASL